MPRYGRDHHDAGWLERAGEAVEGWFGGPGHDRYDPYDRDYGMRGTHRERPLGYGGHGPGGYRDAGWDTDDHRGGGWQGSGYRRGWSDAGEHPYDRGMQGRGWGRPDVPGGGMQGGGYARDDRGWSGGMGWGGTDGGRRSPSGYSGDWRGMGTGRDWDDRDRDVGGYHRGGSYGGSYGHQGPRMADQYGEHAMRMGRGGYGPYGTDGMRYGGASSGGVRPGQPFTGYGHGSGNRYEPLW